MGTTGPSIREVALRALYQFDTEGLFVRDALSDLFKQVAFDGRNRSLATELVYGTVRWRKRLDWVLDQLIRRGTDSLTPWIRNILRMGVYQLMMMDQMPDAAATDEA
ncbi:MAG: transcription antitermination factor NusB, partial [Candidatus Latescibacteria bacterium]|nr:transcription antitermination factor NusB [Candidatus Latescibacterota bacterium]